MTIPFFRTPYNHDSAQYSDESGLKCEDESLAVQAEKEDADINVIVRRFGVTGTVPQTFRAPSSGDFTGVSDYKSALDALIAAESSFMELPGDVRARFENDPQQLISFMENPENRQEAVKLGLVAAPPYRPSSACP